MSGRAVDDHCGVCRVVRELTEHRDKTAPEWGQRWEALNFAIVIAASVCPANRETEARMPGEAKP